MQELIKPYGTTQLFGYSKNNIRKVIHILEKFMPSDDYLITYKDFLKQKDFLRYIGFNINVFNSLVNLTYDLWNTEKRVNRLSLLTILKRYNKKNPEPSNIPQETASKIFELFRQIVFFQNIKKNVKTFSLMKALVNSVMLDVRLKDEELKWLCENAEASDVILNRVLRYKYKNRIISNWVKDNFNNDFLRKRRVELIGWVLDEDTGFKISRDVLLGDFEYINKLDTKIMEKYENDMLDHNLKEDLAKTFAVKIIIPDIDPVNPFNDALRFPEKKHIYEPPVLKFEKRTYEILLEQLGFDWSELHKLKKEKNYEKYREIYISQIHYLINSSMIWGIGYSRLDNKTKAELLAEYYDEKFNYAYFKISINDRNLDLLKWLYENGK